MYNFDKVTNFVKNKHTRNFLFLLITAIIIFAVNGLLPTIEGNTHYTADSIEMTYGEYKKLKDENTSYALTFGSEKDIALYILEYKKLNPDLPLSELSAVEPPNTFKVKVYTKYFFQHYFWYVTTFTHILSAVLLFYTVFNYLVSKSKETCERYVNLENEMVDLSNNHLDPSTFEPWMVDDFNRNRKISQHRSNVKCALSKLDTRTSYKIRLLAKKDPDNKKCIKYVDKRDDLLSQLEEDYINEIVVHKNIRHFKYIHPTFVTCGTNKVGDTTDNYSLIESDGRRISKDMVSKVLMSTLTTVMFATLLTVTVVTAADKPWYWIVIDTLSTIAPLVMQIPAAYDYCNVYMEEQLIANLLSRRSIALLYLARTKEGNNEKNNT